MPRPESLEAYKKAGISPWRVITSGGKIGERHLRRRLKEGLNATEVKVFKIDMSRLEPGGSMGRSEQIIYSRKLVDHRMRADGLRLSCQLLGALKGAARRQPARRDRP